MFHFDAAIKVPALNIVQFLFPFLSCLSDIPVMPVWPHFYQMGLILDINYCLRPPSEANVVRGPELDVNPQLPRGGEVY